MVLELEVEIPSAEDFVQVSRPRNGFRLVPVNYLVGNLTGETGAQTDDPFGMGLDELVVDPRAVVEAFRVSCRGEFHEISVAGLVFREEDEMAVPPRVFRGALHVARLLSDIELASDDGFYSLFQTLFVEEEGAEHVPVVGEGDMRHTVSGGLPHQFPERRCAIEQRIIRMSMQMDEIRHDPSRTYKSIVPKIGGDKKGLFRSSLLNVQGAV